VTLSKEAKPANGGGSTEYVPSQLEGISECIRTREEDLGEGKDPQSKGMMGGGGGDGDLEMLKMGVKRRGDGKNDGANERLIRGRTGKEKGRLRGGGAKKKPHPPVNQKRNLTGRKER